MRAGGRLPLLAAAAAAMVVASGSPLPLFGARAAAAQEAAAQGEAVEEILSYDVRIEIADGGIMEVTEVITVRALRQEIRRGIYRDFPTSFPRAWGVGTITAPFSVVSVSRNGEAERYVLESVGGVAGREGVRVRIGNPNVLLEPGIHTYTLVYETERWIRFGDERDRLDWNVTGNGWSFPIGSASAVVALPPGGTEGAGIPADSIGLEAWTGPDRSTEQNAEWSWSPAEGEATYATTEALDAREGLTIRFSFPSGIVSPPTEEQEAAWFALDWGGWIDAIWVVGLLIVGYLLMWMRVGRDPPEGVVVTRYEPPDGFSPAALGYIRERGYEEAQLTAAIVDLGVKGLVEIEKDGRKWIIRRTGSGDGDSVGEPSPEERKLLDTLFSGSSTLTLRGSSNPRLRKGVKAFKGALSRHLARVYFETNRGWFVAGLAVSAVGFGILAWRYRYSIPAEAWFFGLWLTFWSLGVFTLLAQVFMGWRKAISGDILSGFGAAFMTLFAAPFVAAEIFVGYMLWERVPGHIVGAALALAGINVLFFHLLERPTLKGRGVLDRLEGFREFLGAAEEDRLDRLQAPDRSLELFERFLPYAIALGVENRWAERFQEALTPAEMARSGGRSLAWYHGGSTSSVGDMTSSISGAFSSSLSASSAAPSSGGGGGGGGGSSGGGGGGGGGGGW